MNYQKTSAYNADMPQDILESQVDLFLFDLKNEASERGFRNGEFWMLELATEQEVIALRRSHHPVVSLRLQPAVLLKVYQRVKNELQQAISTADAALTDMDLASNEKKHLAAYPASRNRK